MCLIIAEILNGGNNEDRVIYHTKRRLVFSPPGFSPLSFFKKSIWKKAYGFFPHEEKNRRGKDLAGKRPSGEKTCGEKPGGEITAGIKPRGKDRQGKDLAPSYH